MNPHASFFLVDIENPSEQEAAVRVRRVRLSSLHPRLHGAGEVNESYLSLDAYRQQNEEKSTAMQLKGTQPVPQADDGFSYPPLTPQEYRRRNRKRELS